MEMKQLHCLFFCLSPLLTFEPLCQYLSSLLTGYRAQRCEVLSSFIFLPYKSNSEMVTFTVENSTDS